RRQTRGGAERVVTPTLREHEARVLGAEERLRALEMHLFEALLDTVAARHPTLARTADALATLDALASLAEVAHRRGYVRPAITRAPTLGIRAGRHPVVEAVAGGGFVPNDARLDPEAEQLLVITGPNMGGKSTYLRQVAPITLFATHYHELTALAAEKPRVRNLSVAVAEWKGEIVFLRQIVPGPASRSYGVEVARLAGVPEPVVARARTLLAGLETGQGPVGRG